MRFHTHNIHNKVNVKAVRLILVYKGGNKPYLIAEKQKKCCESWGLDRRAASGYILNGILPWT